MSQSTSHHFDLSMSEQAHDDVTRWPEAGWQTDGVLQRAQAQLADMLAMGQNVVVDVHGCQEGITVRIGLIPPRTVRIEQIVPGGVVPDGALQV